MLYLVFNQGYSGSAGLRREALELGRVLDRLLPREPEVKGLLALMLLHEGRSPGRRDPTGLLIPLEEQHRSDWSADLIAEGVRMLDEALLAAASRPVPGAGGDRGLPRDSARPSRARTGTRSRPSTSCSRRWLRRPWSSSTVPWRLRWRTARTAGLERLEPLADALSGFYLLPATRADLLRRLHRFEEAGEAYRAAVELAPGEPERRYLERRLAEVS